MEAEVDCFVHIYLAPTDGDLQLFQDFLVSKPGLPSTGSKPVYLAGRKPTAELEFSAMQGTKQTLETGPLDLSSIIEAKSISLMERKEKVFNSGQPVGRGRSALEEEFEAGEGEEMEEVVVVGMDAATRSSSGDDASDRNSVERDRASGENGEDEESSLEMSPAETGDTDILIVVGSTNSETEQVRFAFISSHGCCEIIHSA